MYAGPFCCPLQNSKRACIWHHKTLNSLRSGHISHPCLPNIYLSVFFSSTTFSLRSFLLLLLPSLSQAAYREETVLLMLIYKTHPRLTFCYLYLFHYYTMFLPIVQSQLQARDRLWPKAEQPHHLEDNLALQTEVEKEEGGELEMEILNSAKEPVFVRTICLQLFIKQRSLYTLHLLPCYVQFIVKKLKL